MLIGEQCVGFCNFVRPGVLDMWKAIYIIVSSRSTLLWKAVVARYAITMQKRGEMMVATDRVHAARPIRYTL